MDTINDDSLDPNISNPKPVQKEGVIPWYLTPFLKPKLTNQDRHFVLGKPFTINIKSSGETVTAYTYVHRYNFVLGSSWGLLSGMASGSFFKADEFSSRMMLLKDSKTKSSTQKSLLSLASSISRAGVFSWRIASRCSLSFICFELVERSIREGWNFMAGNGLSNKNRDYGNGHLVSLPIAMAVVTLLFPINKCKKISSIFGFCMTGGLSLGLNWGHILLRKKRLTLEDNSRFMK